MEIPSGEWRGTVRTWFEPGADAIVGDITATTSALLDGPTTRIGYKSHVNEHRSDGVMLLGKDIATNQPCLTWVDTFHTGSNVMLFAAGPDGSLHGSYAAGDEVWRWRIVIQAGDELRIEHFNITPAGEEARAIEVVLRRKA